MGGYVTREQARAAAHAHKVVREAEKPPQKQADAGRIAALRAVGNTELQHMHSPQLHRRNQRGLT